MNAVSASSSGTGDLFVERLLRVIDEGRRTTTYKLALLMSLVECAALNPGSDEIRTRDLASEALPLYFRMAKRFPSRDHGNVSLRQINDKSKQFLPAVGALRNVAGEGASLEAAKSLHPVEFVTALNQVEHTFVRYPIPLLQVVGASPVPFLYEQDWPEGTSITTLRKAGQDRIRLLPEVAHRLVALGPLIRPLIEVQWLGDVSRQNDIDRENRDLHVHLFGSERTAFPVSVVEGLLDLQSGACFYCGASVQKKSVDHFIPWSRWPTDAMENLVLADSHCNSSKGDHLASVRHVDHWQVRFPRESGHINPSGLRVGPGGCCHVCKSQEVHHGVQGRGRASGHRFGPVDRGGRP